MFVDYDKLTIPFPNDDWKMIFHWLDGLISFQIFRNNLNPLISVDYDRITIRSNKQLDDSFPKDRIKYIY